MSKHSKKYVTIEEFKIASTSMRNYQNIHNIIRNDYKELLMITEKNIDDKKKFDALYRASLKGLFSIIEADIFGLNNLDNYEGYDDKQRFMDKFKRTFKQISKTWNKEERQQKYFSNKLADLKKLKTKRDQLMHPKDINHLHESSDSNFNELKRVFNDYDEFINDLMNDFHITINLGPLDIIKLKNEGFF